jgi:hypothetical protein
MLTTCTLQRVAARVLDPQPKRLDAASRHRYPEELPALPRIQGCDADRDLFLLGALRRIDEGALLRFGE